MTFLVAYPNALRTFSTREEACAFARTINEERRVDIWEAKAVEHLMPSGGVDPKGGPPGTPAEAWDKKVA